MPSTTSTVENKKSWITPLKTIKGIFRILVFAIFSFICVVIQIFVLLTAKRQRTICFVPRIWHSGLTWIFGLKTNIKGTPLQGEGVLYVSNHLSYLDIPVIGKRLTCYFVAKKEVASWPFFGLLARTQKTLFIKRSTSGLKEAGQKIKSHLDKAENLVVFPEGTSSDGKMVLPFKSSLFNFSLQEGALIKIQPFTIRLVHVDGNDPDQDSYRDLYAWYGDMELLPHLWAFSCSKGAEIELVFHPPMDIAQFPDRKSLAQKAEQEVRSALI